MNIFDIIVYLSLAWAVFNGWRRGFLLQMLSLLAVVAALFFATQYGSELERILGIDVGVQGVVGFIVIFVAAMILIAVFGYVASCPVDSRDYKVCGQEFESPMLHVRGSLEI